MKEINTKESFIQWTGSKIGAKHTGKIYYKAGNIIESEGFISGGEFVVDVTSLTNEDLSGEMRENFLNHMKSDDFFTVSKFPTASLHITSVKDYVATGDLTIKGKTKPVSFDIKKEDDGSYIGDLEFNRTDFDMIYGSGSFFKSLGDKIIHDKVSLNFKLVV